VKKIFKSKVFDEADRFMVELSAKAAKKCFITLIFPNRQMIP
jgi:hypothetical protein